MSHTTTEEHEFIVSTSSEFPQAGVEHVLELLESKAVHKGFQYEVPDTFEIRVTRGAVLGAAYEVRAKATYAKIVSATQALIEAGTPADNPFDS